MNKYSVDDCLVYSSAGIHESNGSLYPIELDSFPFEVKRIFLVDGVSNGDTRGRHAHKNCWQAMCALRGEIEVTLEDYSCKVRTITMCESDSFIIVPPSIWAEQTYNSDAQLICLCSHKYDPSDYLRTRDEYLIWLKSV